MEENKSIEVLNNDNLIEQLFKFKKEFNLIISLVKKNIKILSFACLLGGLLGFTNAYLSKPIYTAKLNFMIGSKSGSNNLSSQIAGLAGVLGVGNSNIGSSLYRMTELTSSDKIITKAIFKKVEIDGSEDFIINHFIKLEELDKSWNKGKDSLMYNISFKENFQNVNEFSTGERSALKIIKEMIAPKAGINGVISKFSEMKTGIIYLESAHHNQTLAIELVNSIYEELVNYYAEESYSNAQLKIDALISKVDSIQVELNQIQNIVGSTSDKTLGLILKEDKVNLKHLEIQEQILTIMYGEAQKNLETFKVMKDTETPPLTLLDYPFSPISPVGKSKIIFMLFGACFLPLILITYFRLKLIYNKMYLEYLNNSNTK